MGELEDYRPLGFLAIKRKVTLWLLACSLLRLTSLELEEAESWKQSRGGSRVRPA